jgi:hypothetical protein
MDENRPNTRPWSQSTNTDCPVGLAEQAWIEASIHWFIGQFGKDMVLRDVALPTSGFFPAAYSGTPEQIETLVYRICGLMSVDPSQQLTVNLFDGSHENNAATRSRYAVGHYREDNGRAVIGLDLSETSDPAFLTAIIAHELCHVRLLGENRITAARKDHERLTDLLTIYLGFGVFTTNAALTFGETTRGWSVQPRGYLNEQTLNSANNNGYSRLGYLTEPEFGYALACYSRLRGEPDPAWTTYLDPGPRTYLHQGLAYLTRRGRGDEFPTLRIRTRQVSIHVVSRLESPAVSFHIPNCKPMRDGSALMKTPTSTAMPCP